MSRCNHWNILQHRTQYPSFLHERSDLFYFLLHFCIFLYDLIEKCIHWYLYQFGLLKVPYNLDRSFELKMTLKDLYNCKNASQCWSNAKIWMKLRRFFLVFYKILPAILTFGLISGVAIIFANSTGDRFAPGYTSLKNILK